MSNLIQNRRNFLKQATAFSIFGLATSVSMGIAWRLGKDHDTLLRPPAAVDDFISLCIKCGQCLQVCPYDSIKLSSIKEGNGIGTPFLNAYARGCYLCALLPCVLACPSGALDHHVDSVEEIKMGKAKVVNINACLALENKKVDKNAIKRAFLNSHTIKKHEVDAVEILPSNDTSEKRELEVKQIRKLQTLQGEPCSICTDLCPYPNPIEAIQLVDYKDGKKPVIKDECVGCGVCVELCPTSVLTIIPRRLQKDRV